MGDRELRKRLDEYFSQKVQLQKNKKRQALDVWETDVKKILDYVKATDSRFDLNVAQYGGSFYERTKTKEPNEFDLMLYIPSLSLGKSDTYDGQKDSLSNDPPLGFTTVMIDQGKEEKWMANGCIQRGNMLSATHVKAKFAKMVSEAVREYNLGHISVGTAGPAVNLKITQPGFNCSIDLALAIKDESWPDDAEDWKRRQRHGWPSESLVRDIVQGGCHLVAKRPKRCSSTDADLFWRYSFSQAEKKLFTRGSSGEAGTCRRMVLRILKSLKEEQKLQLTPLTSYHLKNIMLYEYEAYPNNGDWTTDQLAVRFKSALQRLLKCLRERNCPHYFITSLNLFDSNSFNDQRYRYLIDKVGRLLNDPLSYIQP